MGLFEKLGRLVMGLLSVGVLALLVCNYLQNANEEMLAVRHAEVVDRACATHPELRGNMFVGPGVAAAEKLNRWASIKALQRVITESRIYRIADVHEWVVWCTCVALIVLALVLFKSHHSKRLETERDLGMSAAASAMVAHALRQPQTGPVRQSTLEITEINDTTTASAAAVDNVFAKAPTHGHLTGKLPANVISS